jgi:quercetin dioxygenase-like cupin family protein
VFTLPWNDEDLVSPHATVPGESQVVILHGKQTNNTISLVGVTNLPNFGPPLHVHTLEDEIWHVIDGEYEFQIDENIFRAGPGVTLFGPRNHKHTYRYVGERGVGRLLAIFTPAGIEDFFIEFNAWAHAGKQPTREEVLELADRFRIGVL